VGALSSLTGGGGLSGSGGANTSTVGDTRGGNATAGGISSPIVIGGFKSNGDATAMNGGSLALIAGAVIVIGAIAYFLLRRR
jgi:hypothetical protein